MNEDLIKACDIFLEGIGYLASAVGLNRVIGRLYGMFRFNYLQRAK